MTIPDKTIWMELFIKWKNLTNLGHLCSKPLTPRTKNTLSISLEHSALSEKQKHPKFLNCTLCIVVDNAIYIDISIYHVLP